MHTAHFQNLPEHLCRYLSTAQRHIRVAVCWFSHRAIFDALLTRMQAGVGVALLLEYDSQNIRDGGLDFQQFIRKGGQLWACREAGLMHHKFAIIDDRLLLTGSFNWTYNSNAENLLITHDAAILTAYYQEFERQKALSQRIFQVRRSDVKVFSAFPLFENTYFPLADLRKKVGGGARVWLVRLDKIKADRADLFAEKYLPFDAEGLLIPFWMAYRMWDETLFDEALSRMKTKLSDRLLRDLRRWTQSMRVGDLVFATARQQQGKPAQALIAVGILQSQPQPFSGDSFSSFRAVQWLKILEETRCVLPEKTSNQPVSRYQGSALRVLQEVFGV